jgi:hypothetical protein
MQQTSTETEGMPRKGKKAGAEANGAAHANGHDSDPAFGTTSQPGDQGIATQDDDAVIEKYTPPEPTQQDLRLADEIFTGLEGRENTPPEDVIRSLITLIDVHLNFITPELFGSKDEDRELFAPASVVGEIARLLCRGCPKITAPYSRIGFWFKDHEKWTSAGVTVDAQVKRFDGFQQHINDGMVAAIIVNYHHWRTLNPRQRVFTVYHALRQIDTTGQRTAPDWVGFFEEPGLFGAGVHREMVTMARAFVKDAADHVGEVYQLSILDEVYDDEG